MEEEESLAPRSLFTLQSGWTMNTQYKARSKHIFYIESFQEDPKADDLLN